ncbi:hypothetical protein KFK09_019444 [Dendrobium nobile]|uniref:Uncharacterized protein n=1 Tax=Dendrobium nobile TaxID=94219 RepID=A0A8T3API7_DENNO|nr:hypothetical protein KFK09_019444 [Dendrobium nobile]
MYESHFCSFDVQIKSKYGPSSPKISATSRRLPCLGENYEKTGPFPPRAIKACMVGVLLRGHRGRDISSHHAQ